MKRYSLSEEQFIGVLNEHQARITAVGLCRKQATYNEKPDSCDHKRTLLAFSFDLHTDFTKMGNLSR